MIEITQTKIARLDSHLPKEYLNKKLTGLPRIP